MANIGRRRAWAQRLVEHGGRSQLQQPPGCGRCRGYAAPQSPHRALAETVPTGAFMSGEAQARQRIAARSPQRALSDLEAHPGIRSDRSIPSIQLGQRKDAIPLAGSHPRQNLAPRLPRWQALSHRCRALHGEGEI